MFSRTITDGHTSFSRPEKKYIHQLCVDIWCRLEDLIRVFTHWDGNERLKGTV